MFSINFIILYQKYFSIKIFTFNIIFKQIFTMKNQVEYQESRFKRMYKKVNKK